MRAAPMVVGLVGQEQVGGEGMQERRQGGARIHGHVRILAMERCCRDKKRGYSSRKRDQELGHLSSTLVPEEAEH